MSAAPDLLTFGESMVSLRSAGPLSAGGSLGMHVAGAESNVAVGVARLGHRVAWAGVEGADPLGQFILRQLRSESIRLHPGDKPGIGVDFNEEAAAAFPYQQAYLPYNRLVDGTVHDWWRWRKPKRSRTEAPRLAVRDRPGFPEDRLSVSGSVDSGY